MSRGAKVMNTAIAPMYQWNTMGWVKIERQVFKLQTRIYRAAKRGDHRQVRRLQKLLLRSRAAKLLAVRNVTQDNQGKQTPGVDGVANLTPQERLDLVKHLHLEGHASPVRRVYIPKPGTTEQRPLGIPTMADRAKQALVKHVLEPAWEAQFEPNSYGFRPGRSTWDAMGAIYVQINQKPKWVLDADIAKCFDRIDHEALLRKLNVSPTLRRQITAWLKGGLLDKGAWFPTEAGTPQGGPASPLLANVALHGLEETITRAFPGRGGPAVVRYADDLVVLHPKREVIERCQAILTEHLREMGLALKPSKTRITHTLQVEEGEAGFDFLGFNIRQYPTKSKRGDKTIIKPSREARARHQRQIGAVVRRHRRDTQARLIEALNPVIRGWSHYFSTVCSHETFEQMDEQLRQQLRSWIRLRHPNKTLKWGYQKYWRGEEGQRHFKPQAQAKRLRLHTETPIQRHVKVQGRRSPYDGDEVYWGRRRAHHPGVSRRVAR
ncbi:MAG: group II intron reverse transcriptase/maturase, partial [Candidatus Tectomicrobia bacterium]|nr:group II intron reverse transcriptase/maturase [Candidatus Tectomicrobia bacterium]